MAKRPHFCGSPQVGALRPSAWLNIQLAIEDLMQPFSTEPKPEGAKRKQDTEPEAAKRGQSNVKEAVIKALNALGGTATRKQVMAYLQSHPEVYVGADASNMKRSIQDIRLRRYCDLSGINEQGEDVFCLPASQRPTGVRRMKHGFVGRMHIQSVECRGPLRRCAKAAMKDFQKMQKWRATMTPDEVIQRVQSWDGARVTRGADATMDSRRLAFVKNGHRPTLGAFFASYDWAHIAVYL